MQTLDSDISWNLMNDFKHSFTYFVVLWHITDKRFLKPIDKKKRLNLIFFLYKILQSQALTFANINNSHSGQQTFVCRISGWNFVPASDWRLESLDLSNTRDINSEHLFHLHTVDCYCIAVTRWQCGSSR